MTPTGAHSSSTILFIYLVSDLFGCIIIDSPFCECINLSKCSIGYLCSISV